VVIPALETVSTVGMVVVGGCGCDGCGVILIFELRLVRALDARSEVSLRPIEAHEPSSEKRV